MTPGRCGRSDGVLWTGFWLAWLTPLSVVLPLPGLVRLVVLLLFVLVVPGAALVCRLDVLDPVVEWALTMTAGLVAFSGGAVLMAWTGWWQPNALVLILAAGSLWPLCAEVRRRSTSLSAVATTGR